MRLSTKLVTAGLTTMSLLFGAGAANAATPKKPQSARSSPAATTYNDSNVVDFLIFGRGPIATEHPALLSKMGVVPVLGAPSKATETLTTALIKVDPSFSAHVTNPLQSHDPYKVQDALATFTADLKVAAARFAPASTQASANAAVKNAATSKGTVAGYTWIYLYSTVAVSVNVAVSAAFGVSILALAAALVVFAYEKPVDGSDLYVQNQAATLCQGL